MLSRKSLLTAVAVVVPLIVFAVTSLTDPAESGKSGVKPAPRPKSTSLNTAQGASNSLKASSGQTITVSARPRTDQKNADNTIEAFTEPYRDIAVAASEMGTLSVIKVIEGDIVKQGDIIAVMDDDVLRASVEVARRSMSVEGLVKSAQADLDMKKAEHQKLVELRDRDHASQQEVDRVETEIRIAEARLLSVMEDLEVKELEYRRIESQLQQRSVRAPIDGVISELSREAGEFVSPSDPTIARLVQLDTLLIVFSVPLTQRNEVEKDQKVTLKIGVAEEVAEGIVEYVSPTSDSSNSSVRVKVRLPNADRHFQSGERTVLVLAPSTQPVPAPIQPASTPVARREP